MKNNDYEREASSYNLRSYTLMSYDSGDSSDSDDSDDYSYFGTAPELVITAPRLYPNSYTSSPYPPSWRSGGWYTSVRDYNLYWPGSRNGEVFDLTQDNHTGIDGIVFPTNSLRITDVFNGDNHKGIDIGAVIAGVPGDSINAMIGGTIEFVGVPDYSPSGSTYIIINGDDVREYRYLHIEISETIKKNDRIERGEQIATMSDNGSPGQVHLHLEIFENGNRINPLDIFPDIKFIFIP